MRRNANLVCTEDGKFEEKTGWIWGRAPYLFLGKHMAYGLPVLVLLFLVLLVLVLFVLVLLVVLVDVVKRCCSSIAPVKTSLRHLHDLQEFHQHKQHYQQQHNFEQHKLYQETTNESVQFGLLGSKLDASPTTNNRRIGQEKQRKGGKRRLYQKGIQKGKETDGGVFF